MGSRPSTPDRPVKARGSRSRTGYPNEGDQSSNDVVGPVEPILAICEVRGPGATRLTLGRSR